ncbi:MAG: hydroxymethylglutaryl-CoA lyase [Halieaceae bacterium]|nr:hydroxymethylglutaryl-CoA lyase [Halieaceae bacterium]
MRDILISEVGPRDGLQNIKSILPTEAKKRWIHGQHQAGASEIEVGSFVPAQLLPQLADTAELVAYASGLPDLTVSVLAPNKRGLEAAVKSGAHKGSIPFSMSESHSIKNVRKNHPQMLEEVRSCIEFLRQLPRDRRPAFEVSISTAFGCTIEGEVPEDQVLRLVEQIVALGADEVCLCDTTGYANPVQLARLLEAVWANCGRDKMDSVHLHNTRGQGIANALRAVELGITTVDASLGGLGGCPFAPGASGNIVTEDLVFLLESMGLRTGMDLPRLLEVREQLQRDLPGEELYGFVAAAGLPKTYTAAA